MIRNYLKYIHYHFGVVPKFVRTDKAMKFLPKDCTLMFEELGIVHQRTMVYIPQ